MIGTPKGYLGNVAYPLWPEMVPYDSMGHNMHGRLTINALTLMPAILMMIASCQGQSTESSSDVGADIPTVTKDGVQHLESTTKTDIVLASGELLLPAASAFGTPGFHEVLIASDVLSNEYVVNKPGLLVVSLRDASRPEFGCSSHHPLSGCATVDWADAESRPNVPPGGVFENSITLNGVSGTYKLFLSRSGFLNELPNEYEAG